VIAAQQRNLVAVRAAQLGPVRVGQTSLREIVGPVLEDPAVCAGLGRDFVVVCNTAKSEAVHAQAYNFIVQPVSIAEALEKLAEISTSPRTFFVHVRVPAHVAEDLRAVQKRVIPDASMHEDIDHITLVYTRKPLEDHAPDKVHAALSALREIGETTEPITAKLQGWGFFDGASKDGKPSTALVALVDAPGLEHLHVDMSRRLKDLGVAPSDLHVFTPHITLGYLGHHGRVDVLPPLNGHFTIDKAHVASRDHHEIPLAGEVVRKAASLGEEAAQFAMSPSELRTQHRDPPGKGETSAVVGRADLQGAC
jgi:2'-5' RNA ligase